jgi:hypothetical protein
MSVCLACVWFFVAGSNISAVIRKQILAPYKDEDKPEGAFRGEYSQQLVANRSQANKSPQQTPAPT